MINFRFIFLLFLAFNISGCQEELEEITEPQDDQVISSKSTVVNLLQRVALSDGSSDNIIDNSSCVSIVLPVTVIANGQEVVVDSEEDYNTIEKIFDKSELDEDDLEIIFPVKIILADHSELIINNEDELEGLTEGCTEGGDDDDIECLDFLYPLQFSVYDADNQISSVKTVNNDSELYQLFAQLDEGVYMNFEFPVTLRSIDGGEIYANNNEELEDIIEDSISDCDEDDDNDFDEDDIDDTELRTFVTTGKWEITSYYDGEKTSTAFGGITFSFDANGFLVASDGVETVEAEWETYGDSGVLELEFDFESIDPYKDLNDEWQVANYTSSKLELEGTGGSSAVRLVFEKI